MNNIEKHVGQRTCRVYTMQILVPRFIMSGRRDDDNGAMCLADVALCDVAVTQSVLGRSPPA
jgi:hypothetical protein